MHFRGRVVCLWHISVILCHILNHCKTYWLKTKTLVICKCILAGWVSSGLSWAHLCSHIQLMGWLGTGLSWMDSLDSADVVFHSKGRFQVCNGGICKDSRGLGSEPHSVTSIAFYRSKQIMGLAQIWCRVQNHIAKGHVQLVG